MTCNEFLEGFSELVDGEATEAHAAAAREHMQGCPDCRRYHQVYHRGVDLLRSFPGVAVEDGFENDLEVRLRRDTSSALRHLGQRPPQAGASMAMVFGMAVVLVGVAWSPFLLVGRIAQVDLNPIVATRPVRALPAVLQQVGAETRGRVSLLPEGQRRSRGDLRPADLWDEPESLFREYAPVMRAYTASARLGLD